MNISRKPIFDAVRVLRDGKGFTLEEVEILDAGINAALASIPEEPPPDGVLQPSPKCFELIMSFEGLHRRRPDGLIEAYPDPASGGKPWTIGYGTTGPDVKKGTVWTLEQAVQRFEADLRTVYGAGVRKLLSGAPTAQHQYDALVSFAYNVGLDDDADTTAEGLGDSTLMRKHKAGDFNGAAAEFSKWINADGRPMNGLRRRRAAEADLYRGG